MAIRSLDPAADFELRERELDRKERNAKFTLRFEDLIDKPIVVEGVTYDLTVDVFLTKHGKSGPIEIDSIAWCETSNDLIYITVPGLNDPVGVTAEYFKAHHRRAHDLLEKAIDALALSKAAASHDWEMEDCDE